MGIQRGQHALLRVDLVQLRDGTSSRAFGSCRPASSSTVLYGIIMMRGDARSVDYVIGDVISSIAI